MKILILTQNVSDMVNLKSGLTKAQTLCNSVGLTLSLDYQTTAKKFSTIALNTDVVVGGYEVNPTEILSEAKPGYDIACLIYDSNAIFPHPTNPCTNSQKGETPMQIPINWYSNLTVTPNISYPDVLTQYFLHELSHYCAFQSGQPDLTHLLVNRNLNPILYDQWSSKSPIDFYLFLIKGYLKQGNTVIIKRDAPDGKQTTGHLTASKGGAILTCQTLELSWLNNKVNVSSIPLGTYNVVYSRSPRLGIDTYEILNVPGRSGIRIHAGNTYHDSDGCILLGAKFTALDNDEEIDITNSQATVNAFEGFMNKQPFQLTIN